MTPERWQQIKQVLATALETPPAERRRYLEQSCNGDPQLRQEVEQLLELDHASSLDSEFLNHGHLAEMAAEVLPEEANPWIGRRVGPYEIVEQIGAGGMGEVYRAFRADEQYRKDVALKLIRSGQDSALLIKRFRNERQILANLEHPNIARLLDGGTITGTPYLIMELVEGRPLQEYCAAQELSVPERLQLFLQVCSAIQYAHQHLIIHRDIKPSNILVTAEGVPKLLDFGIAKILDAPEAVHQAEPTLTIYRALTPQYASPEQIKGETITTATDVYSLGVVLYELLTGQSPYGEWGTTAQEALQAICETEIRKPSTAVRSGKATQAPAVSEKVARQLRGDLDNIVLMALRKEPQRRYSSAEQFAEDIRRYLQNLPVVARKDTATYRTSKFLARHKAGVLAAAVIVIILVVGIITTARQARIAKRRFNDVRSLANSLIFDLHDSVKELPGSTPARKLIVERALQYLNVLSQESSGDLGLQRELAAAYTRVGSVQGDYLENNLGDAEATLASYQKALTLREQIARASKDWEDRFALAQSYRMVAHQLWANGDPRAARQPIGSAIEISTGLNTARPSEKKILAELAFEYETSGRIGYPDDAAANQKVIADYRHALAVDEATLKLTPDDVHTLHGYSMDLSDIGGMLEGSDPLEALKNYQKGLEIDRKIAQLSTDIRFQRSVAIAYGSIASVYDDLGEYAQAVENDKLDLAIYQKLVQADSRNVLLQQGLAIAYINMAAARVRAGEVASALEDSERGLAIIRPLVASASATAFQQGVFAAMEISRGTILIEANQASAAIPELERGRAIYASLAKTGAKDIANVAGCDVKLGEASAKAGRDESAAEYFHKALAVVEPLLAGKPQNLDAIYAAADAYSGLGDINARSARHAPISPAQQKAKWAEAQSYYTSSLQAWHQIEHPNHTAPNSFHVGDPVLVAKNLKIVEESLAALR